MLEFRRGNSFPGVVTFPDLYVQFPSFWANLHDVRVLWELAVLGVAFLFALLVNSLLHQRLAAPDDALTFGLGGLQRLQMPLSALVVVLAGRSALRGWYGSGLLDLAVPLLTALAIVRIVVYALRRAFAPSGWLKTSERFVAWTVWTGFAIYMLGLAPELIAFLDGVGFRLGKDRVSLLLMLKGVLMVGATLLAALWLGSAIESRVMGTATLDINLRVMFAKLVRAGLLLLAVLIALPAIGLDITALSVFGGALGVGLGLGLQKVASNYLSGFIILMDRSVTIGDVVTVERFSGKITKMTARYVVVRALDGTETIIPNETMIASPVVNHYYSDRRIRLAVSLKVGRRSDLEVVMRLMEEAGKNHPRVMRDPPPRALVKEYTNIGATVELGVWIGDPEGGNAELASDLYTDIWRRFKAAGI
ncbi:MAG TPA: mechanosensitive ion channel domain-containing protein [Burkholderiales bacterium]|nr:mechanosensitive ion channel domain-containing protein [Burkholderiales bacterium]